MRRFLFIALSLALATVVHVDWHFARPTHHRLSLGWNQHWLFAAVAFGLVGWAVARTWPARVWRRGSVIAAFALVLAQLIEPVAEVALYRHRIGYPDEPARWTAFVVCIAVGLPAYCLALWLCRPTDARTSRRRAGRGSPSAAVNRSRLGTIRRSSTLPSS
jgi:hypothetical protein